MIRLPLWFIANCNMDPGDHVCITVTRQHVGPGPEELALIGDYWVEITRPWKRGDAVYEHGLKMDLTSDEGLMLRH